METSSRSHWLSPGLETKSIVGHPTPFLVMAEDEGMVNNHGESLRATGIQIVQVFASWILNSRPPATITGTT